jgi:glutathione S-transferase
MLQIWGRLSSINVRKVVWCAQELGLAFQRTEAGGRFGVVQTPAYRALNPNSLVPTIEDDGVRLWESNVIVRYLCARHAPGSLRPVARFDTERWMDWQQTTLNPAGRDALVQWVRTPANGAAARSVQATGSLLALLDAHLATRLHGRRTLRDGRHPDRLRAAPLVRPAGGLVRPPAWPRLERYFAALRDRAAARSVLDLPLE